MSAFARGYAQALLAAAPPQYDVEGFLERAGVIRRALAGDPRLKAFFAAPAVPAQAKSRALEQLTLKAGLDPYGQRFFQLLLRNRRLLDLPVILATLRAEADRAGGVVEATVTVAKPVDQTEQRQIEEALTRATGQRVRLKTSVDEAILGGFVARVGSELFDASVRRAIEQFEQQANEGTRG